MSWCCQHLTVVIVFFLILYCSWCTRNQRFNLLFCYFILRMRVAKEALLVWLVGTLYGAFRFCNPDFIENLLFLPQSSVFLRQDLSLVPSQHLLDHLEVFNSRELSSTIIRTTRYLQQSSSRWHFPAMALLLFQMFISIRSKRSRIRLTVTCQKSPTPLRPMCSYTKSPPSVWILTWSFM